MLPAEACGCAKAGIVSNRGGWAYPMGSSRWAALEGVHAKGGAHVKVARLADCHRRCREPLSGAVRGFGFTRCSGTKRRGVLRASAEQEDARDLSSPSTSEKKEIGAKEHDNEEIASSQTQGKTLPDKRKGKGKRRSKRREARQRAREDKAVAMEDAGKEDSESAPAEGEVADADARTEDRGTDEKKEEVESDDFILKLLKNPATRRRVTRCETAEESLYELAVEVEKVRAPSRDSKLSQSDLRHLLEAIVESGNPELALGMFTLLSRGPTPSVALKWDLDEASTRSFLLLLLVRCLHIDNAVSLLQNSFKINLAGVGQVDFGAVVSCPYCMLGDRSQSLAVVKPHLGSETVSCASCRYDFDLFSGTVARSESESIEGKPALLSGVLSLIGLGKNPSSVHSLDVQAPDGTMARTFKFATSDSSIPAAVGDRVTVIASTTERPDVMLQPRPPGWKKGQAKALFHHRRKDVTELLRVPDQKDSVLSWVVPAAVLFAGGDVASGLFNPDLPVLILSGTVGVTAAALISRGIVLPQLAKLPAGSLTSTEFRQQFLEQYCAIRGSLDELLMSTYDDLQLLSRLWQLHHKMEAFGGGTKNGQSPYDTRLQKVLANAQTLEDRVMSKMELIDGYMKVANMIEIEIELDTDLNAAEASSAAIGIGEEMKKLSDLEALKEDWAIQVEAKDEIEKLLQSEEW